MNLFGGFQNNDPQAGKLLAEGIGRLITAAVNVDSDKSGKIETSEWVSLIMTFAMSVGQNIAGYQAFVELLKETDTRAEVIEAISGQFDIPNDELEELIEDTFRELNDTSGLVLRWIDYGAKVKQSAVGS